MKTIKNSPLFWCSIVSLAVLVAVPAHAQTVAFPGAQGFGAYATGGRGGTVYHVTTLADSGAGSFRDAVSSGNRIVVFDVGGYISLSTAVSVNGNNITIAGQTAPGGGIGFKGGEISFASRSNIICRYIRVRPGSDTASSTDDALSLYRARDVILDHTSFEFAPWNNIDGVSDDWQAHPVTDITIQNSISPIRPASNSLRIPSR
jgi:pectate lyase